MKIGAGMTILRLILLFTPSSKYKIQKAFVREIRFLDTCICFACLREAPPCGAKSGVSCFEFGALPDQDRGFTCSLIQWIDSSKEVPPGKMPWIPISWRGGISRLGMTPPMTTRMSSIFLFFISFISLPQIGRWAPDIMDRPMTSTPSWMAVWVI